MRCPKCLSKHVEDTHVKLKTEYGYVRAVKCRDCGELFSKELIRKKFGFNNVSQEVVQLLNGQEVGRYPSLREASRKTGIPRSSIYSCIYGDNFTAGGYEWESV